MCFSLLPSAYSLFLGSFGEEGVYVAFESFDALDTHIRFVDTIVGVQKDGCRCGPKIERTGCFPPVDKHGVGDVGAIDETLDLLDVVVEPHPDDGDIFVLIVKGLKVWDLDPAGVAVHRPEVDHLDLLGIISQRDLLTIQVSGHQVG